MIFTGKHVLVVGGTSGIGLATTRALLQAGAQVTATGVTPAEVAALGQAGERVRAVCLDVRDNQMVRQFVQQLDRLDILVQCAGTILRGGREHEPDGFDQVVNVNLSGTMRVCSACLPLLTETRGNVVTIASLYSTFGAPHAPAYSASKGGVVQLTRSLAVAWGDRGIRVNAVLPGWIETPFTQPLRDDPPRNDAVLQRTVLRRWGRPEEVANAILFLASEQASFITGSVLVVDGGFSVM